MREFALPCVMFLSGKGNQLETKNKRRKLVALAIGGAALTTSLSTAALHPAAFADTITSPSLDGSQGWLASVSAEEAADPTSPITTSRSAPGPIRVKQGNEVYITIDAGEEAEISSRLFGVPDYGAESVQLEIQVKSERVNAKTISVHPKGAALEAEVDRAGAETLRSETATGIDGMIVVANEGATAVELGVRALEWVPATRAIPVEDQDEFISRAMSFGASEWMAEMAVWDAELAATLPVGTTVTDAEGVEVDSDESTAIALHIEPSSGPKSGATATAEPQTPTGLTPDTVIVPADASDGTCSGNYRLTDWSHKVDYTNWANSKLWSVKFKKKFCFNPGKRVVGTTYWFLEDPQFTTVGDLAWIHNGKLEEKNVYLKWDGKEKGSHRTQQKHAMKHCTIKWAVCEDPVYYNYLIRGYGDGSKTAKWD